MTGQLSAFGVLELVLVVGFVSALFGVAGGVGAGWVLHARMHLLEDRVGSLLVLGNRLKGVTGQEVAREQKARLSKREQEAEALAAQLVNAPGNRSKPSLRALIKQEKLPDDAQFADELAGGITGGV